MDSNPKSHQKGLLNEEDTKKNYKPEMTFSDFLGSKDEIFSSFEVDQGRYAKLEDNDPLDSNPTTKKQSNLSMTQKFDNVNQQPKIQNLSSSMKNQYVPVQNQTNNMQYKLPNDLRMTNCQFCKSKVMIPGAAKVFRCCYCKNVNDKSTVPTVQHNYFLCGKCRKTVAYVPISPYVRCICGTVNYVPPIVQGTDAKATQQQNLRPNTQQNSYPQFQLQYQQPNRMNQNSSGYPTLDPIDYQAQQLYQNFYPNSNPNLQKQATLQKQTTLNTNKISSPIRQEQNFQTNHTNTRPQDTMPKQFQTHSESSKQPDFLTSETIIIKPNPKKPDDEDLI